MTTFQKQQSVIKFLQKYAAAANGEVLELAYSGGKDSDVILRLAQLAGIKFRAIYKNTTIDPPGTIAHVKANNVEIRQPKYTFFQLIEKKGFPTRWRRFCCRELKEYKILDKCIIGVRQEESTRRAKHYKEPTQCRVFGKNEKVEQIFPILTWTMSDVEAFIQGENITLAPAYYDDCGKLHIERRLGCMGCPLKSDCGRADFRKYPKLVKAWLCAGNKYIQNHSKKITVDVYALFSKSVFFQGDRDFYEPTLFSENWRQYLEDYFGIDLKL